MVAEAASPIGRIPFAAPLSHVPVCMFWLHIASSLLTECKQSLELEFVAIANSKFLSDVLHPAAVHNIDLYIDATSWLSFMQFSNIYLVTHGL